MKPKNLSIEELVNRAQISQSDHALICLCRRQHNRLGFGYQLSFVRMLNRFPAQVPFEVDDDILNYASVQLGIPSSSIELYSRRRETVAEHQERIRNYLNLSRFGEDVAKAVQEFLFREACRLEQTAALIARAERFLRERKILRPSDDTLQRIIGSQRNAASQYIFKRIMGSLTLEMRSGLDSLLDTKDKRFSGFHSIKQPPGRPSPKAMLKLIEKIETIQGTGALDVDLSWLSNNYQRSLSRYAKRCDAHKMRELEPERRYSALACFLAQGYRDTVDFMVDMYDKLISRIYSHAQRDVDDHNKSHRKKMRVWQSSYRGILRLLLDETVDDPSLRGELFREFGKDVLELQMEEVAAWLDGKHSHVFNLVKDRFSYIRQFSPHLLKHLRLRTEAGADPSLAEAVDTIRGMNEGNRRKVPEGAPLGFIPKKILPLVKVNGNVEKPAWECALLTAIRDEIKAGNYSVENSKRFGRFDDFFMVHADWDGMRESFFRRTGFPANPEEVESYLTKRLNGAYEQFLAALPQNAFAKVEDDGWSLSSDPGEKLDKDTENRLNHLNSWLSGNMRKIKLPELLIEVDNALRTTRFFMAASQQDGPSADDICAILATIMAHGCNVGTYTMSQIIDGISYSRLKHITDWMLTEESQRSALAAVVNAITNLDITQSWGTGRTSSSDGQRFALRRKVLQQTYSPKFNDFALEFYSFVADNYAPFYSLPIECTDRDAPFVLDGILYNESDLPLEEHYVDTHGYTENNFAAFAMLGKRFSPRIRGLHKQRIYRIDESMDYGALSPLVGRKDRRIHMDWIVEQWDRLGHFYASLESGHTTASTAMKRLNSFTGKNQFYRGNRELGRVFKTEYILRYMSDKSLRLRTRRGLLKGEQLHGLARDLKYGKRGRISNRDLQEQRNSCSCLTLILASIIYWQAKEINRVVLECDPEGNNIDLRLMEHVSPIAWENVILYGEYVLNRNLIRI